MASNYKAKKADGVYELSYAIENKRQDGDTRPPKCLVFVNSKEGVATKNWIDIQVFECR